MHTPLPTDAPGLEALLALPVVPGNEPTAGQDRATQSAVSAPETVLDSDRAYRLCKAIVEHPLRPGSAYPALAGLSPRTVKPIRERLLSAGLIREHRHDSHRRGRTAVLLEARPEGEAAVRNYEAQGRV